MNAAVYLWRRWRQARSDRRQTTIVFQLDASIVDAATFARAIRRELNRQAVVGSARNLV